jgi:hypothetical protein
MEIISRLFLLCFALTLAAQNQQKRLGEIDFFGYGDLDPAAIRAKLPVKEGDVFN